MHRRDLLKSGAAAAFATALPAAAVRDHTAPPTNRNFWLSNMRLVVAPVLDALSKGRLKASMPVEAAPSEEAGRRKVTHLEAFGRTLAGIAPWLDSTPAQQDELALHRQLVHATSEAMVSALDPSSPDCIDFGAASQNVVDAGFLSLAILRAPNLLNKSLDLVTKKRLAQALMTTRQFKPPRSNWLLFAAATEAALHALGEQWDRARVDDAFQSHMKWFIGDGTYGDGPHFHADYYNSFVIQPFFVATLQALSDEDATWKAMRNAVATRAMRYAHIQERMIAADGSYPVVGRSITYRCGAFHHLADAALRDALPQDVKPEQVRSALGAVIRKTLGAINTFDEQGWLRIGLCGHQPSLGETYISTGSLYLCSAVFLPLGLRPEHRFWAGPDTAWTAPKVWRGEDLPADHAIDV